MVYTGRNLISESLQCFPPKSPFEVSIGLGKQMTGLETGGPNNAKPEYLRVVFFSFKLFFVDVSTLSGSIDYAWTAAQSSCSYYTSVVSSDLSYSSTASLEKWLRLSGDLRHLGRLGRFCLRSRSLI